MTSNSMNVVLTADRNYLYPLGVCMTSILHNVDSQCRVDFHLFLSGFTADDIELLNMLQSNGRCTIVIYDMAEYGEIFQQIDVKKFKLQYVSLATMHRLLMFKILPEHIGQCFYVDADMIVGTDLSKLLNHQSETVLASCVVEILAMAQHKTLLKHLQDIEDFAQFQENPNKAPYFNAGFYLVNLDLARRLNVWESILDFLSRYPNVPYADQDILNAVIGQQYREMVNFLNPAYNVFCDLDYTCSYRSNIYSEEEIRRAINHPCIYHYGGGNKPWLNNKCINYFDVWWNYAQLSPWSRQLTKIYQRITDTLVCDNKSYYLFGFIPFLSVQTVLQSDRVTRKIKLFNRVPFLECVVMK